MRSSINPEQAANLSVVLLKGIQTEFPNFPNHILYGPEDVRSPKSLHPSFYGCFDWHSAVHSHWALVRLLNVGAVAATGEILEVLGEHLSRENILIEAAYLGDSRRSNFERTYGWAWLQTLDAELAASTSEELSALHQNLKPLKQTIVAKFLDFLPNLALANRTGLHNNTAFTLGLVLDYAVKTGDDKLRLLAAETSLRLFLADKDGPINAEPGPVDFLSPCLVEADLMRRLLSKAEYCSWFDSFLPGFEAAALCPAVVSDRADLHIVHLEGLNLSRAWCMINIANALGPSHPAFNGLTHSADAHARASLPHVASGYYSGEHWLPSFAIYLLTCT